MTWQLWILVGIHAMGAIVTVGTVGEQRKPTTPGVAAIIVAVQLGVLALIFTGA